MKLGSGAKTVLILAGFVIVVAGLKLGAPLIVPFLTAAFITVLSLPVVRWLMQRKVPRLLAMFLALLLNLSIFAGIATLIGGSFNEFYSQVPQYQARLTALAEDGARWLDARGAHVDVDRIGAISESAGLMTLVAELFQSLASLLSKAFLVSLLVLFMLFEAGPWRMKMGYVVGRPSETLPRFETAAREVQTYLFVKSGLSLVTGLLCGGWAAICGVDFPLLWGLLAFLLNYIPTLGMFIATIPPVLVALIQLGPGPALVLLVGYLVINFVLGNFVEPRIVGRALGLSPLVVFLSMIFWGWLWGPVGALLAVPLTMVMKILLSNTEDLRWAAVLLGSEQWLADKRKEWGDPVEEDRRRSLAPPPPEAGSLKPPPVPAIDEGLEHDEVSGSRPRRVTGEPDRDEPGGASSSSA